MPHAPRPRATAAYVRRAEVAVFAEASALLVALPQTGKCLRLMGTSHRIWELLEYPTARDDLVRQLREEFAGDGNAIAVETHRWLDELGRRGLVVEAPRRPSAAERQRDRYLWLLKRSLVNFIYPEHELRIRHLETDPREPAPSRLEQQRFLRDIRYRQGDQFAALAAAKRDGSLFEGREHRYSHTMIGLTGLDNLERCAERVFADRVPGDFLEAGVCAGGAAIFLRALQVAFGQPRRRTWAADSFEGLPPPRAEPDLASKLDFTEPRMPWVCFGLEGVRDNFARYGLLDDRVRFLRGWFRDTLPTAPIRRLAILRIDADLYESTREVLASLYDKVADGGFIIVDDYGAFPPCQRAVDEFRAAQGITAPLQRVDRHRVFWRRVT